MKDLIIEGLKLGIKHGAADIARTAVVRLARHVAPGLFDAPEAPTHYVLVGDHEDEDREEEEEDGEP